MFRARLPSIFITSHKNATPAREFAPCRHLTQPWQCDSQKHARHVWSAAPAMRNDNIWRWTRPKCCACHENCNSSCENVAKVLRLPHTPQKRLSTPYETRYETQLRDAGNIQNDSFCRTYYGMAIRPSRERLRTVRQRRANTPSTPQTPRVKQEPLLRIREKSGGLNPNLVLINTTSFADPAPQRQAALAGSWSSDRSNHLPVQSWFSPWS